LNSSSASRSQDDGGTQDEGQWRREWSSSKAKRKTKQDTKESEKGVRRSAAVRFSQFSANLFYGCCQIVAQK